MKALFIGINLLLFLTKFIIQIHLDYKHQRFKGLPGPDNFISFLLPYMEAVKPQFKKEKHFCDLLYKGWLVSIVIVLLYQSFS